MKLLIIAAVLYLGFGAFVAALAVKDGVFLRQLTVPAPAWFKIVYGVLATVFAWPFVVDTSAKVSAGSVKGDSLRDVPIDEMLAEIARREGSESDASYAQKMKRRVFSRVLSEIPDDLEPVDVFGKLVEIADETTSEMFDDPAYKEAQREEIHARLARQREFRQPFLPFDYRSKSTEELEELIADGKLRIEKKFTGISVPPEDMADWERLYTEAVEAMEAEVAARKDAAPVA